MNSQRPGMIWRTVALIVLLAAGAGTALQAMELDEALRLQAYPPPPPTPAQVLIRNATVWTMTETGIVDGMDVLLDKGKIAAIGRNLGARADALVIDGETYSVLEERGKRRWSTRGSAASSASV